MINGPRETPPTNYWACSVAEPVSGRSLSWPSEYKTQLENKSNNHWLKVRLITREIRYMHAFHGLHSDLLFITQCTLLELYKYYTLLICTYYPPVSSVRATSSDCPEHDSQLCGVGGVSHPPDGGRQAHQAPLHLHRSGGTQDGRLWMSPAYPLQKGTYLMCSI